MTRREFFAPGPSFRSQLGNFSPAILQTEFILKLASHDSASVLKLGLSLQAGFPSVLAAWREHLRHPGSSITMDTLVQVWGRSP